MNYFSIHNNINIELLEPQNYDKFTDMIRNQVKENQNELENTVIDFLQSRGYNISKDCSKEEFLELKEQLVKEDKFIDYMVDARVKEIADGYRCVYTIIPFLNSISSPIDEKTKEILLENWRNMNDKNK